MAPLSNLAMAGLQRNGHRESMSSQIWRQKLCRCTGVFFLVVNVFVNSWEGSDSSSSHQAPFPPSHPLGRPALDTPFSASFSRALPPVLCAISNDSSCRLCQQSLRNTQPCARERLLQSSREPDERGAPRSLLPLDGHRGTEPSSHLPSRHSQDSKREGRVCEGVDQSG